MDRNRAANADDDSKNRRQDEQARTAHAEARRDFQKVCRRCCGFVQQTRKGTQGQRSTTQAAGDWVEGIRRTAAEGGPATGIAQRCEGATDTDWNTDARTAADQYCKGWGVGCRDVEFPADRHGSYAGTRKGPHA